jgi:crotonobetainyl-CoA:carnitine CoA-transferase CaiB-like acyl-CoA transferase
VGAPLAGVTVVECSLLEPGQVGMILGSLGADVIKVEAPGAGDYSRRLGWPIVDGVSLLHWHVNQAKRSITLDLRDDEGAAVFLDLTRTADIVVSGMRPGALARRGLGYQQLCEVNPRIVFCELSGYGATGPYRDMPSHGVGFDAWAGCTPPAVDEEGLPFIPPAPVIGSRVGPVWAATAVLAGVLRARETGRGCEIDVAQADAAAYTNWIVPEGNRAYQRPEPEVTGHPADGGARRAPGLGGSKEAVRYQYYRSRDGHVLFMASEREFWRNFCVAVGREDLYDRRPGERYGDHATGDRETRRELQKIFEQRTTAEWAELGDRANTPIAPVHDGHTILDDPHFRHRFPWRPAATHGTDLMPIPIHYTGEDLPDPRRAPGNGEHTVEILRDHLGYDDARIAALLDRGAPHPPSRTKLL